MKHYIFRRIAQVSIVAVFVILGNFILLKSVPGDLVDVIAGESGSATPEYMDMLRVQFGLDRSGIEQLAIYFGQILHFDLGFSFRYNMPVTTLILERMPATLLLLGSSILFAVVFGVIMGCLAARYRHGAFDQFMTLFSSVVFAIPVFWFGLMGIVLFAVHLRWLPIGGMVTIGASPGALGVAGDIAWHLIMPAITLSLSHLALYARVTRASMLEVYHLDFVRTARAKGISEAAVTVRHVLRNSLLPVVTLTGLQLGSILGGAVVVETVFSWPGMGRLAFEAVADRDINLLLSLFLCNSLLVVLSSLLIDILYGVLDPRVGLAS
ncbi:MULTISPECIES: ABC transporter permease [unclassified Brenneria]|uniref:ABC transporter permease n=1 Tax=unclassified Brenneria TaxID=2634434 RepID=UPI0029C26648|nr:MULTISPECIES: ABC transporter permease [unclassified Brenneria]MDX5630919.1 ABC transporter permease [Brenneria sp. L3-3Z]MDX5698001.1 ABC transporter permease [Brenneria sp. L4-2C]